MRYEVWAEGYAATGESGGATFLGYAFGSTFKNACESLAKGSQSFAEYFDADRMTYWGCRLFDNQAEAQKSFG